MYNAERNKTARTNSMRVLPNRENVQFNMFHFEIPHYYAL